MKLVRLDWVDSHSGRGWQDRDRLEEVCSPLYVRSVGWVVSEEENCITIASSISSNVVNGNTIQGCGDITIPKRSIFQYTVLVDNSTPPEKVG